MWLFQSKLEALGLQQKVEDVKPLKMRIHGADDGEGGVILFSLVLVFQILNSSQNQIKLGNNILLLSVCCGTDLFVVISYSFAGTPVSVVAVLIEEFISNLFNLILLLGLGIAIDVLLCVRCYSLF